MGRLPAAALLLTALAALPLGAQDFRWSGRVASGGTLEIKGVNGEIRATPSASGQVEVTADKRARRSDEASVRVEVLEHAGGVTICAVYPTPRNAARQNRCAPGDDGHMSVRDNDVSVNFAVRVPAGVAFAARTVNGEVEAEDLRSDVVARTVNGNVDVSTTGRADARTVNGSIGVAMGRPTGDLEFQTVNGSITIAVDGELDADLDAQTVNGGIESDFPMTISGRMNRRHIRATIGAGGPDLFVKTVNGGIRIRRR
jgi:hypothetical protein